MRLTTGLHATLGARGAFGASTEARVHDAAPRVGVVDTIGAGDAFGAGLLAWLNDRNKFDSDLQLASGELADALRFACLGGRDHLHARWR